MKKKYSLLILLTIGICLLILTKFLYNTFICVPYSEEKQQIFSPNRTNVIEVQRFAGGVYGTDYIEFTHKNKLLMKFEYCVISVHWLSEDSVEICSNESPLFIRKKSKIQIKLLDINSCIPIEDTLTTIID